MSRKSNFSPLLGLNLQDHLMDKREDETQVESGEINRENKYEMDINGTDSSEIFETKTPSSVHSDSEFTTSKEALSHLNQTIVKVNSPLLQTLAVAERKKLEDKAKDERTAKIGGMTRCCYKATQFFSWSCCRFLPRLCKATFVLLAAGATLGAAVYLKTQADEAGDYQPEGFVPGATYDNSIDDLGAITNDLYNLTNQVWPLQNLARMGYMAVGILGLVWSIEYFIYRYIADQNQKTRQAGENDHEVNCSQNEVIKMLVQEVATLKNQIAAAEDNLDTANDRIRSLTETVQSMTGNYDPQNNFADKEETVTREEDAKEIKSGPPNDSTSGIKLGFQSKYQAELQTKLVEKQKKEGSNPSPRLLQISPTRSPLLKSSPDVERLTL